MPPFLRYLIRRLLALPVTLIIVTGALYAFMMITPAEERASLFLPRRIDRMTPDKIALLTQEIIKERHLNEPFPIQYGFWAANIIKGEWGYSPLLQSEITDLIRPRSLVTIELTLYTLLTFIPLGLISGLFAAQKHRLFADRLFRFTAFSSTSIPPFILAIMLLGMFYVTVKWFPPERLSTGFSSIMHSEGFRNYTGLITIDGILNGRLDLTLDAIRHLVLPVFSLGLLHWATLGRIVRVTALEERRKLYILSARAHGVSEKQITWRHILRNILSPALSNSALSAASLFTGVIVIEKTFNFYGISDMVLSITSIPDMSAVMGFAVYSVLVVQAVIFIFDFIQAMVDPRVLSGEFHG
jgi:ABC-type dipeptide/oligopeptide/nickel transport system permease component